ncbi:hypothetical protein F5Y16DRAFT_392917 [Xylariaceae sp. FL0255]|nr:hypothetical protein F5Y16DRAFT_392917 [Xylariaceae sp. FL0255]
MSTLPKSLQYIYGCFYFIDREDYRFSEKVGIHQVNEHMGLPGSCSGPRSDMPVFSQPPSPASLSNLLPRKLGVMGNTVGGVREGLDITEARNYRPAFSMLTSSTSLVTSRKGRSRSKASMKRSSSQTGAALPPGNRSCSTSPTKAGSNATPNRIHQRVILRDYSKPIYEASSRAALLDTLEGCIKRHESLLKVGLLHRDISINNLIINEDEENSSWPSFLIDLDLVIRERTYLLKCPQCPKRACPKCQADIRRKRYRH